MSRSKRARVGGLTALGAVLVVTAALMLLVWGRGSDGSVHAQGLPTVGMTLGGPATAPMGETFQITVNADPAPTVDLSGFQSEVLFGGLEWTQRAACEDEAQVGRQDGQPLASCVSNVGPVGQARHVVVTAIQLPPLPALDALSNGDPLVELDVECPAEGTYNLVLTASAPDVAAGAFGASYFNDWGVPIFVQTSGTQDIDLNGDTAVETVPIADTMDVTCVEAVETPPPTEELSPAGEMSPPETGTGAGIYGGDGSGLWATIGALLAAASAGLVVFGWRYARSRR